MPSLFIKNVPEELYRKLEEMANTTGRSKQDIVIEALQLRIYGQQVKPDVEMVEYTEPELKQLLFPAKCVKCNTPIPAGEIAWLSKAKYSDGTERWLAWHFDCLLTDKKLARLWVEKRKLEKVVKALKQEANKLADVVNEAETRKKILDIALEIQKTSQEIEKRIYEATSQIQEWLTSVNPKDEELKGALRALIEELNRMSNEYSSRLDELEKKLDEAVATLTPRKMVKRARKEETWQREGRGYVLR